MANNEKKIEILKSVALKLGDGWFYNELLSSDSRFYHLNNRKGLFLQISTDYGCNIEQWRLCVKDNNYNDHFRIISRIGCSLEKNISSIVSDVKSRLLSDESLAYEKIIEIAKTKSKKNELIENRKHVINSLEKVLSIKLSRRHCYNWYEILDSKDLKVGGFEHLHDRVDTFDLHLRGVSSENIIKIMGLLASKQ
jgi:hypothetical protein